MTARATSTTSRESGERMATTKRRGPRYRTVQARVSYPVRESLEETLARKVGVSVRQLRRLRYEAPSLLAHLIVELRALGQTEAVAAIIGPIDRACAGAVTCDSTAATLAEQEAENATNLAELRYQLDRSEENRQALLRLSAREIRLQTERDALLAREEG